MRKPPDPLNRLTKAMNKLEAQVALCRLDIQACQRSVLVIAGHFERLLREKETLLKVTAKQLNGANSFIAAPIKSPARSISRRR